MIDSGDMFGEGPPPEDGEEDKPSAAELEEAGQAAMFGDPAPAAAAAAAEAPKTAPATPYRVLAR